MSFRTIFMVTSVVAFFPSLVFATSVAFPDVTASNPNKIAIEYLQDNGVINGYGDGTFKPQNKINRAELLKVLVEGQGITPDASTYSHCFPDVKDEWFVPYVCYAEEAGWVSGYPDGTFQPARTVLKVESLKMILNAYGFTVPEQVAAAPFADTNANAWYTPFVAEAKERGLLEETGGTFEPAGEMARGGVAENIFRSIAVKQVNVEVFSPTIIETAISMPIIRVEYVDTLITGNTNIDNSTHITNVDNSVTDNSSNTTYNIQLITPSNPDTSTTFQTNSNTAALNALNSEYKLQFDAIDQQIVDLQSKYYEDVENLKQNAYLSQSSLDSRIQKLTSDTNFEIQKLQTKRDALWLEYERKADTIENASASNSSATTQSSSPRSCTVENGTGQQAWNTATQNWGACTLASCNSGFVEQGNVCTAAITFQRVWIDDEDKFLIKNLNPHNIQLKKFIFLDESNGNEFEYANFGFRFPDSYDYSCQYDFEYASQCRYIESDQKRCARKAGFSALQNEVRANETVEFRRVLSTPLKQIVYFDKTIGTELIFTVTNDPGGHIATPTGIGKPTIYLASSSPSGSRTVCASDNVFVFEVAADNNGKVLLEELTVQLHSDSSFNLEQGSDLQAYLKEGGNTVATSSITLTDTSSGSATFTFNPAFEIVKGTRKTFTLRTDTTKLISDESGTDDPFTLSIDLGTKDNAGGFIWSDGITSGISWVDTSNHTLNSNTLRY
ncbi:S-layer homology domain-containing protein [Candidatus Gracilibacteria bacterium]|nr:S-layer homology domain-containing protein [Candidatus Gracilibacteria bacterium]